MGVPEGDIGARVPHALRYGDRREAHLYQQRDVAVAQVVYADALDVGLSAPAVELVE